MSTLPRNLFLGIAFSMFAGMASATDFIDWDSDGDELITNNEFYGGVYGYPVYTPYDTDGDGFLSEDEFGAVGLDASFDEWDEDDSGWLDSGEYYDGYYGYYDADDDGYWDDDEWNEADDDGFFDIF